MIVIVILVTVVQCAQDKNLLFVESWQSEKSYEHLLASVRQLIASTSRVETALTSMRLQLEQQQNQIDLEVELPLIAVVL